MLVVVIGTRWLAVRVVVLVVVVLPVLLSWVKSTNVAMVEEEEGRAVLLRGVGRFLLVVVAVD